MKIKNVKRKKQKNQNRGKGRKKDHYTIVNHYNDARLYSPFYGTGEQLKKFALKMKREKYEGKLPKRVEIQLVG